ncbi:hypothetical protein QJQ45_011906 [Haematococcus lacustris]|nr:hypothetical protein QJQ45_011906 [Haematococcus lacustris]
MLRTSQHTTAPPSSAPSGCAPLSSAHQSGTSEGLPSATQQHVFHAQNITTDGCPEQSCSKQQVRFSVTSVSTEFDGPDTLPFNLLPAAPPRPAGREPSASCMAGPRQSFTAPQIGALEAGAGAAFNSNPGLRSRLLEASVNLDCKLELAEDNCAFPVLPALRWKSMVTLQPSPHKKEVNLSSSGHNASSVEPALTSLTSHVVSSSSVATPTTLLSHHTLGGLSSIKSHSRTAAMLQLMVDTRVGSCDDLAPRTQRRTSVTMSSAMLEYTESYLGEFSAEEQGPATARAAVQPYSGTPPRGSKGALPGLDKAACVANVPLASEPDNHAVPLSSLPSRHPPARTLTAGSREGTGLSEGGQEAGSPASLALLQRPGVRSVVVTVKGIVHQQTGQRALLVMQQNTSQAMETEKLLADLAEAQLRTASTIFPRHVVEFMTTRALKGGTSSTSPQEVAQLARQHKDVTLLFMDIVGFTSMAKEVAPETVMVFLNTLFGVFDLLVDVHGVMKVETAGDCYIVAGGILSFDRKKEANGSEPSELGQEFAEVLEHHDPADSAARVMAFAKDMMASSKQVKMPHNDEPVCIRIGLHTGDCVSGLIGTKAPKYAVFGDTMNTASRMESTCTPGRIQVSAVTHALLPHEAWEATGGVLAKGKVRHTSWLTMDHRQTGGLVASAMSQSLRHAATTLGLAKKSLWRVQSLSQAPSRGHSLDLPRPSPILVSSTSCSDIDELGGLLVSCPDMILPHKLPAPAYVWTSLRAYRLSTAPLHVCAFRARYSNARYWSTFDIRIDKHLVFLDMARASEWAEVAVAAVQFNVSVLSSDGQRLLYTSTPSPVEPACNEVADRRNGDCLMQILGGDRAAFLDLLEHTVDGALWQGTVTSNHVAAGLSRSISRRYNEHAYGAVDHESDMVLALDSASQLSTSQAMVVLTQQLLVQHPPPHMQMKTSLQSSLPPSVPQPLDSKALGTEEVLVQDQEVGPIALRRSRPLELPDRQSKTPEELADPPHSSATAPLPPSTLHMPGGQVVYRSSASYWGDEPSSYRGTGTSSAAHKSLSSASHLASGDWRLSDNTQTTAKGGERISGFEANSLRTSQVEGKPVTIPRSDGFTGLDRAALEGLSGSGRNLSPYLRSSVGSPPHSNNIQNRTHSMRPPLSSLLASRVKTAAMLGAMMDLMTEQPNPAQHSLCGARAASATPVPSSKSMTSGSSVPQHGHSMQDPPGGILSFDRKKEANGSEPSELGQEFAEVLEHHDPADSAARVMAFAKDMMASSKQVKMPHNDEPVCIRIGLHTGDCVSGLIGTKAPKYAVFGDTMNTASRMESTCTPGRIQVSAVTHALLPHEAWEATGGVLAKGKVRHTSWLTMDHRQTGGLVASAMSQSLRHAATALGLAKKSLWRVQSLSQAPSRGHSLDLPRPSPILVSSTSCSDIDELGGLLVSCPDMILPHKLPAPAYVWTSLRAYRLSTAPLHVCAFRARYSNARYWSTFDIRIDKHLVFLDMARASEWAEVAVAAVQFNVSVLSSDGQRLLYTSTPSPVEPACNEVADRRNGDCLMQILGGDRAAFLDLLEHTVDGALWQGTVTSNHVAAGLSRSISRRYNEHAYGAVDHESDMVLALDSASQLSTSQAMVVLTQQLLVQHPPPHMQMKTSLQSSLPPSVPQPLDSKALGTEEVLVQDQEVGPIALRRSRPLELPDRQSKTPEELADPPHSSATAPLPPSTLHMPGGQVVYRSSASYWGDEPSSYRGTGTSSAAHKSLSSASHLASGDWRLSDNTQTTAKGGERISGFGANSLRTSQVEGKPVTIPRSVGFTGLDRAALEGLSGSGRNLSPYLRSSVGSPPHSNNIQNRTHSMRPPLSSLLASRVKTAAMLGAMMDLMTEQPNPAQHSLCGARAASATPVPSSKSMTNIRKAEFRTLSAQPGQSFPLMLGTRRSPDPPGLSPVPGDFNADSVLAQCSANTPLHESQSALSAKTRRSSTAEVARAGESVEEMYRSVSRALQQPALPVLMSEASQHSCDNAPPTALRSPGSPAEHRGWRSALRAWLCFKATHDAVMPAAIPASTPCAATPAVAPHARCKARSAKRSVSFKDPQVMVTACDSDDDMSATGIPENVQKSLCTDGNLKHCPMHPEAAALTVQGTAGSPMATAAGPGQQEEIWQGWSTMPPGSVLLQQPGVQSVRVTVRSIVHPRTREGGLLVVQQDTTDTSAMEALLADLAESQLRMASNIFPRHGQWGLGSHIVITHGGNNLLMQVLAAAILAVLEFLATNRGNNAPEDVAQLARQHKDVTLLFMDIVGFTSMAKEVAPETVMVFLNTLFGVFDLLVDVHGVMKVETAGDCYIVAGGILSFDRKKEANGSEPSELGQEFAEVLEHHDPADSAARVMAFAKDMMASSKQVKMPHNDEPVCIRIGLHTGDCVSGLIGTKAPKYAVFGDTMNTASRMESTCTPGRIQVSAVTHALLPHEAWEATGGVLAKGKGLMLTYIWVGQLPDTPAVIYSGTSTIAKGVLRDHEAVGVGDGAMADLDNHKWPRKPRVTRSVTRPSLHPRCFAALRTSVTQCNECEDEEDEDARQEAPAAARAPASGSATLLAKGAGLQTHASLDTANYLCNSMTRPPPPYGAAQWRSSIVLPSMPCSASSDIMAAGSAIHSAAMAVALLSRAVTGSLASASAFGDDGRMRGAALASAASGEGDFSMSSNTSRVRWALAANDQEPGSVQWQRQGSITQRRPLQSRRSSMLCLSPSPGLSASRPPGSSSMRRNSVVVPGNRLAGRESLSTAYPDPRLLGEALDRASRISRLSRSHKGQAAAPTQRYHDAQPASTETQQLAGQGPDRRQAAPCEGLVSHRSSTAALDGSMEVAGVQPLESPEQPNPQGILRRSATTGQTPNKSVSQPLDCEDAPSPSLMPLTLTSSSLQAPLPSIPPPAAHPDRPRSATGVPSLASGLQAARTAMRSVARARHSFTTVSQQTSGPHTALYLTPTWYAPNLLALPEAQQLEELGG